jgi:hypothetical protein
LCAILERQQKTEKNFKEMETKKLNETVEKSIQNFYNKNDFGDDGGISEKFAWIKFGFISLPIPNFESRKNNVYLHDVHHIITDNNTTWKGESAVSAWEIASGGWGKLYIPWLLTLWAMGLGVLFHNSTTMLAFEKGLTMRNALTSGMTKTEISNLTIGELREKVSNQPQGNGNRFFWSSISLIVFFIPFVVCGVLIFGITRIIGN